MTITSKRLVLELLPEGHELLTCEQLSALCDVANRVGFDVIEQGDGLGPDVYRIKVHVSMRDPADRFFFARLSEV